MRSTFTSLIFYDTIHFVGGEVSTEISGQCKKMVVKIRANIINFVA